MGTECAFAIFMLFNSLCLELAFCAADGGSGASSRRTLQWIAKNLRKCEECSRRAHDVVGMIELYAPALSDSATPTTL